MSNNVVRNRSRVSKIVRSSLVSSDNGGCALEMPKDEDSSVIDSVMARIRAAVSSTEMASIVDYLVGGRNAPFSKRAVKRNECIAGLRPLVLHGKDTLLLKATQ